jgi:cell division protein FtsA
MILHDMERQGILHQLGAGIVLTGGGSQMRGLIKLTERVFRLPCMLGRPVGFSGLAAISERPEYATVAGLIRYAFINATREKQRAPSITRVFKKLFGNG